MRPIKLTIKGIGPYKEVQTIDFSKLRENNLFLITGPTGAGKTTIFDALAFALYGEASGEGREQEGLKSHYLDSTEKAFVELEFRANNEKYLIKRYPKQFFQGTKGNLRDLNQEVNLTLPNHTIITKIQDVKIKIEELMGLNARQFKQIVMLPQGDFKKLLEADSKDKEIIFRNIFGTDEFKNFQERLKDKKNCLEDELREENKKKYLLINSLDPNGYEELQSFQAQEFVNSHEFVETLKNSLTKDEDLLLDLQKKIRKAIENQLIITEEKGQALRINQDLESLEKINTMLMEFEAKQEEMEHLRHKVMAGEKALSIKNYEELFLEALREQQNTAENLRKSLELESNLALEIKKERTNYLNAKEKEGEKNEFIALASNLCDKIDIFERIEKLDGEKSYFKVEENRLGKIINELKEDLAAKKQREDELQRQLVEIIEVQGKIPKTQNDLKIIQETLKKIGKLSSNISEIYPALLLEHKKGEETYLRTDEEYSSLRELYNSQEDLYMDGLAGVLAANLEQGLECPVCGSTTHPKKAKKKMEIPTEIELKNMKENLERLNESRERAAKQTILIKEKLDSFFHNSICACLNELNLPELPLDFVPQDTSDFLAKITTQCLILDENLNLEKKTLEATLRQLEEFIKSRVIVENSLEKSKTKISVMEKEIEDKEISLREKSSRYIQKQEELAQIQAQAPKDILSKEDLLKKIKEIEDKIKKIDTLIEAAKNKLEDLNQKRSYQQALIAEYNNQLEIISKNLKIKKEQYLEEIAAADFKDEETYTLAFIPNEELEILKLNLTEYERQGEELVIQKKTLAKNLQGKKRVDIEELEYRILEINRALEVYRKDEFQIKTRFNKNQTILQEFTKLLKGIQKIEEKFLLYKELAELANGKNDEKLTFERYVLAAYFRDIIHAANLRLGTMTNNRYQLLRKEEKNKGQGQAGLDLLVFDAYSGTTRSVKTLSGGESFKASLALALGLADVIQSYAGGIEIDTMFIDEGFGTLDQESLDASIKALIEINNSGRLVGIISHVSELKERVQTRIEIDKNKDGSNIKFIL